jgi:hypothetical protein
MRLLTLAGAAMSLALSVPFSHAWAAGPETAAGPATTAGPGRIVCKTAASCILGIGTPATLKFQVDTSGLPGEDKDRLGKQCKSSGKTPCVVTVQGNEMGDPMKVKAASIKWYN